MLVHSKVSLNETLQPAANEQEAKKGQNDCQINSMKLCVQIHRVILVLSSAEAVERRGCPQFMCTEWIHKLTFILTH